MNTHDPHVARRCRSTQSVLHAWLGVSGATVLIASMGASAVLLAMHQFRFIHPPGGAMALTAVIAGPAVTGLGYSFVWRPVAVNAVIIVAFAVVSNAPFSWRRYPARLARRAPTAEGESEIPHEQVVEALRSLSSFVDITEDDLLRLTSLLARAELQPASEKTST